MAWPNVALREMCRRVEMRLAKHGLFIVLGGHLCRVVQYAMTAVAPFSGRYSTCCVSTCSDRPACSRTLRLPRT